MAKTRLSERRRLNKVEGSAIPAYKQLVEIVSLAKLDAGSENSGIETCASRWNYKFAS